MNCEFIDKNLWGLVWTGLIGFVMFAFRWKLAADIQNHTTAVSQQLAARARKHAQDLQEHAHAFSRQIEALRSELAKDVERDGKRYQAAIKACNLHDDLLTAYSERYWAYVVLASESQTVSQAMDNGASGSELERLEALEEAAESEFDKAEQAVAEAPVQLQNFIDRNHLLLSTPALSSVRKTLEEHQTRGNDDDWRAERQEDVRATLKAEFYPEAPGEVGRVKAPRGQREG